MKKGHQVLAPRPNETYITFHYSGVVYNFTSIEQEKRTILNEATFHINKNWSNNSKPAYGDGLMYDFVVLSNGEIVQTRRNRQQLWHCANFYGNECSWSTHVMLGLNQSMTIKQRDSLYDLFNLLREKSNIPRENVIGHCEWPVAKNKLVRYIPALNNQQYTVEKNQSICPGPVLIRNIIEYRDTDSPVIWDLQVVGMADYAPIYTNRDFNSDFAQLDGKPATLAPGTIVQIKGTQDGWAHMSSELGFIPMSFLKEVNGPEPTTKPVVPPQTVDRQYTAQSYIIVDKQPNADEQAIIKFLAGLEGQTYTEYDLQLIVGYYKRYGELTGVDWVFALSQNMHETYSFRSWWAQRPRRNPAGLRVTGERRAAVPAGEESGWAFNPSTGMFHKGMSFETWEDSVKAHLAYLISYARTNDQLTQAQVDFIKSTRVAFVLDRKAPRGIAAQAIGLNGVWAVPGTTYAQTIAKVANSLMDK